MRDPLGFSFELSESAPPVRSEEQSPIGDLDLDFNEFGPSQSPAPGQAAASWLSSPFSPLVPEAELPLTLSAGASAAEPSRAPAIKKISFPRAARPSKAAKQTAEAPAFAASAVAASKSTPTTRFSASISQRAPEAALIDRDSDPDHGSVVDHQAIPEDLPEPTDAVSVEPERGAAAWSNDTPTAQEIWRKARRVWQTTSKHAVTFSGQGLKSAQKLAQNVNHKLQTRLEDGAKQRRQRLDEQSATLIQPRAHAEFDLSDATATEPKSTLESGPTLTATEPSQLRLRQGSGRTQAGPLAGAPGALKKAAAPLSALAAAALVYVAGSYVFGVEGAVSLSKSAAAGPHIPELGSLPSSGDEAEKAAASKVEKRAASAASKAAEPVIPEMKSEQTTMPEGLSWPGKGLIEVVTSEDELIYIDGVFTGRGPLRRIPVTPGKHHVAIKAGGQTRTGEVQVEADKNTRAVFKAKAVP